jgi:hypothetical protein
MYIKLLKRNRMIVVADCVWHGLWSGWFITPAIRCDSLPEGCWTIDIIWLKLYITFGYVKWRD